MHLRAVPSLTVFVVVGGCGGGCGVRGSVVVCFRAVVWLFASWRCSWSSWWGCGGLLLWVVGFAGEDSGGCRLVVACLICGCIIGDVRCGVVSCRSVVPVGVTLHGVVLAWWAGVSLCP